MVMRAAECSLAKATNDLAVSDRIWANQSPPLHLMLPISWTRKGISAIPTTRARGTVPSPKKYSELVGLKHTIESRGNTPTYAIEVRIWVRHL
jgi:hypothetical protein